MTTYCKVLSRNTSWLVAHPRTFRLFMKGKFDAYVLRPLAKTLQNWIIGRITAHDFTVCTKYNNFLWVYWSSFKDQLILTYQRRNSIAELTLCMNNVTFLNSRAYRDPLSSTIFFWATLIDTLSKQLWLDTFTGYSFWDRLCIFLHKIKQSVLSVHKLNR